MIGRQLSHFRIVEQVGAGGMGVVYRALDLRLQRTVALKILPAEATAESHLRGRLLREARAASALNHPHIVTVHEVDSADGVDFIAMEFVEGRPLDEVVGAQGLPLKEALSYATQIAEALAHAHARGIVHRDLKPRNVMVSRDRLAKVLDFGLAKHIAPTAIDAALQETISGTAVGALVGTPHYMSPEQAQGLAVDSRSDIFSLGAVLYEMLAGRRAFAGDNVPQIITSVLRDHPPALRSRRPELPAELDRIVAKALEKDRDYRYQHVEDLLADLRTLERDLATPAPAAFAAPPPVRRRTLVLALIGAAAVALTGLALWLVHRSDRPPRPERFRLVSTFPGSHHSPSFSPDGTMVAFVSRTGDVPQIWVTPLSGGEPIQITTGEVPAERPRWSPKNDQVVYSQRDRGIWAVPPLGGTPRLLVEGGYHPNLSRDGEWMVFEKPPGVWLARSDGSEARQVEGIPETYYTRAGLISRFPALSPDGRTIAYFQPTNGPIGDLWRIPAGGGTPQRLTQDRCRAGQPVWTADGRALIFWSERAGSVTLWRIPAAGGTPEPLTTGAGEDSQPELSADGRRLLYTVARHAWALVILDPKTGAQREVLERRTPLWFPAFSPAGERIAFFARMERESGFHIFTIQSDGRGLRQITRGQDERNMVPEWSHDGAALYFYQWHPTQTFRKVSAEGGASTAVLEDWLWEIENGTRVDPTGQRVVYTRLEENRRDSKTLIRDLETGREQPLPLTLAGASCRWSPDGSAILGNTRLFDPPPQRVVLCPLAAGDCRELADGYFPRFSRDGSRIFFLRSGAPLGDPDTVTVELWSMSAKGADLVRVAVLTPMLRSSAVSDVSPHDEVVWTQFRAGREELWLADLR